MVKSDKWQVNYPVFKLILTWWYNWHSVVKIMWGLLFCLKSISLVPCLVFESNVSSLALVLKGLKPSKIHIFEEMIDLDVGFSSRVTSAEALFPSGISIFNLAENMVQLSQNWATLPDRFLLWRRRQAAFFFHHSTQCFLPNGRVFTPVKGCIIQVNEIILNLHQLQIFASETRIIKPILKEKERRARRDAFISI